MLITNRVPLAVTLSVTKVAVLVAETPIVTGVTPKVGSRNGGTRITVHGISEYSNVSLS